MSEELIKLKGIVKSYGKNQVLNGVDMSVNKGDIYGLIGKNGSGKTTLFKVILGLSPYRAGEMSVFGGTSEAQNRANRKRIGFLVAALYYVALPPVLSVKLFEKKELEF
ncbi:MAG: ATP-binding cassette domain-containing protein [Clostridia bacterium]|nr:ATP-binding cassette domain-containing protein [Clostridia bacterium]